jgi:hypothetical protein
MAGTMKMTRHSAAEGPEGIRWELTDVDLENLGVRLGHRKRVVRIGKFGSSVRPSNLGPPASMQQADQPRHGAIMITV